MIYLILDTNAWIYLANGFNPLTSKNEENTHLKLLKELKQSVVSGKITILTNDIILEEWHRNSEKCNQLIDKIHTWKKEAKDFEKKMLARLPDDKEVIKPLFEKYGKKFDELIKTNQTHIQEVKALLFSNTLKYPITVETKLRGSEQAIKKLAPFIGDKKNSMADFVILLGAIEYIEKELSMELLPGLVDYPESYFVSSNKNDFSDTNSKGEFHKDLYPFIEKTKIQYRTNLPALMNELSRELVFSHDEIDEYQAYHEDYEPCPHCDEEYCGYVYFNETIRIRDEKIPLYDEKQLRFEFDTTPIEELNKHAYTETEEGYCNNCGGIYIRCVNCGELVDIYYGESCECSSCDAVYQVNIKQDKKGQIENVEYILLDNEE